MAWAQVTVGNTRLRDRQLQPGPAGRCRARWRRLGGADSITTGNLITSFDHSLNAEASAITASPAARPSTSSVTSPRLTE